MKEKWMSWVALLAVVLLLGSMLVRRFSALGADLTRLAGLVLCCAYCWGHVKTSK